MSGTIKITKSPSQDRLNIYRSVNPPEEKYELSKEDFYTEMLMRGFQYSEDFKNIVKVSANGTCGLIRWRNDWIKFIDGALQLYAFGHDSRQVEVPLLIRKIVIDHKQHETAIQNSEGEFFF